MPQACGVLEGGDLLTLLHQALSQCPDTLLVLSGYSQGAQLVHNSAELIATKVTNFVAAGTCTPFTVFTQRYHNLKLLF